MDKPISGLVHGGGERQRDLEAVIYCRRSCRALCRRVQNARIRDLPGIVLVNRSTCDQRIKVGRRSSSTETDTKCSDGTVAKGAPQIPHSLQETDYSLFRFFRSEPIRTILSVGARDEQHHNCRFLHAVLSAARLALLVRHRCSGLFANLSRLALAQRCDCYCFPRNWW